MSVTESGDDIVLGSCVTSTLVAAGGGGVTVLLIWKILPDGGGVWSLAKTINGMLAGNRSPLLSSSKSTKIKLFRM